MNIMKLMKQATEMQKKMESLQSELGQKTVEFSSGGGMVTVVAGGDQTVRSVRINPKVVDPNDVEMLEDLVRSAVDGALQKARDLAAGEMKGITAGLNLPPGMKMPF